MEADHHQIVSPQPRASEHGGDGMPRQKDWILEIRPLCHHCRFEDRSLPSSRPMKMSDGSRLSWSSGKPGNVHWRRLATFETAPGADWLDPAVFISSLPTVLKGKVCETCNEIECQWRGNADNSEVDGSSAYRYPAKRGGIGLVWRLNRIAPSAAGKHRTPGGSSIILVHKIPTRNPTRLS